LLPGHAGGVALAVELSFQVWVGAVRYLKPPMRSNSKLGAPRMQTSTSMALSSSVVTYASFGRRLPSRRFNADSPARWVCSYSAMISPKPVTPSAVVR
jgi:hypothetical protein